MSKNNIIEIGKIKQTCPKCGKDRVCISFQIGNLVQLFCSECLFDLYGYGKPNRDRDVVGEYIICEKCNKNTMKKIKTSKQGQYLVDKYSCDICGQSKSTKIKCWKLRDGCETRGVRRNE